MLVLDHVSVGLGLGVLLLTGRRGEGGCGGGLDQVRGWGGGRGGGGGGTEGGSTGGGV